MQHKKRILACLLAATLYCTSLPLDAVHAEDAEVTLQFTIQDDDTYAVTGYDSVGDGVVEIPELYNGSAVTVISGSAFYGCTELTSLEIPESVVEIGDMAFEYCENLSTIEGGDNVSYIGELAFFGTALETVTLSANVSYIGSGAFSACTSLNSIEVDAENTVYGSEDGVLFAEDSVLESGSTLFCYPAGKEEDTYTVSGTYTVVEAYAFAGTDDLTSVALEEGVTMLESFAFASSGLTSVTLPASIASIGYGVFYACEDLQSIAYAGTASAWEDVDCTSGGNTILYEQVTFTFLEELEDGSIGTGTVTTAITTTTTTTTTTVATSTTEAEETDFTYDGFAYGTDTWSFNNSTTYFGDGTTVISNALYNTLMHNLSNTERLRVQNYLNRDWEGSCYGLSVTAILASYGILDVTEYDASATCLHDLSATTEVLSLINYYAALQKTRTISQNKLKSLYIHGTEEDYLQDLVDQVSADGGTPTLLTFYYDEYTYTEEDGTTIVEGSEFGHAVVAYGIETGTYTFSDKVGTRDDTTDETTYAVSETVSKTYDSRLLIYDSQTLKGVRYLYYNSGTGEWYYPYEGSEDVTGVGSNLGAYAYLSLAISDYNLLNYQGFLTGTTYDASDSTSSDTEEDTDYVASFEVDSAVTGVLQSGSGLGESGTFTATGDDEDNIKTYSLYADEVDSESETTVSNYAMWESERDYQYTLDTEGALENASLEYEGKIFSVQADNASGVLYSYDDIVQVYSAETTDYTLSMTFDEGYYTTDWYAITVSGEDVSSSTLEAFEDGYLLTASNLEHVEVLAYQEDKAVTADFSLSGVTSVYLYAADASTIGVKIDADGDGVYETDVLEVETGDSLAYGDLNHDSEISASDWVLLTRYITGTMELTMQQVQDADLNTDDVVDSQDAEILYQYILGTITSLPVTGDST